MEDAMLKMILAIELHGCDSKEALAASQELDPYIVEEQKKLITLSEIG